MLLFKILIILINFNLIFISSIGYGYLLNKFVIKKSLIGIYELFFYSIPLLLLISFTVHYFSAINYKISSIILFFGIIYTLYNFRNIFISKKENYIFLFSNIIFIPFVLGGSPHSDFYYHHLPYLNMIFNYKIVFGLVNFNDVLANPYMAWFNYTALFNLPPFKFQINHIVNGVLFFSYLNYILADYINQKNNLIKILNIFLIPPKKLPSSPKKAL